MIRALSSEPLNGRWLLTGLVGRGRSGTVYRGFDLVSERVVAIKTIGGRGSGSRLTRRARREFLDLATLRHPNLVETYELAAARSGPFHPGAPFFTMELLEDAAISRFPTRRDARALAHLALDLLAALGCVHGHGLVHNDVKPSNVLRERDGAGRTRMKLSDLGLASRTSPARAGRSGWRGTLHYAAPERIAGEREGPRSDLYSLGVLLFEAATGALPFDDADPAAALEWHLRGNRGEGSSRRSLPRVLTAVIDRLLAVSPDARFPRARDAWEEIADAMPGPHEECEVEGRECTGALRGRSVERRRLIEWMAAASGTGGCLVLRGREGAGLSRCAREAEILGHAEGWAVHAWRCTAEDAPFSPLSHPLREIILRACPRSEPRRRPGESELLALLGGPALWSSPRRVFNEAPGPLARSLARFLAANSLDQPLLIVLDDFDRADEGTRLVVRSLSESLASSRSRLMIVASVHDPDEAVSEAPAAAHGSSELTRIARESGIHRWEMEDRCVGSTDLTTASGRGRHVGITGSGPAAEPSGKHGQTATRWRGRAGLLAWASAHRRFSHQRAQGEGAAPVFEIDLGPLSLAHSRRLLEDLPCLGRLQPADVESLFRHAEGLPGRLVRLAHAMAGRQRVLFPPLSEPRPRESAWHSRETDRPSEPRYIVTEPG